MIMTFRELVIFAAVLLGLALVFALAIIVPFLKYTLTYLRENAKHDKELAESCHNFQRELNRQTLLGFNKNYEALSLCSQALNSFMDRTAPPPEPPKDRPKGN